MVLKETDQRILDYLKEFQQKRKYMPTKREIQRDLGMSSPSVVQYHLLAIQRNGFIEMEPLKARAIRLVQN